MYFKYKDQAGKWQRKWSNRSIPNHRSLKATGIYINAEGPTHIHDVTFKDFGDNDDMQYCGIEFRDKFDFGMGASSSVKGIIHRFISKIRSFNNSSMFPNCCIVSVQTKNMMEV